MHVRRVHGATAAALTTVALAMAACSSPSTSSQSGQEIVFGTPASDHAEAVLVDISKGGQPAGYCSGSIISPYVVLTAGHCVDGYDAWHVTAPYAGGQTGDSSTAVVVDYKGNGATLNLKEHDVALLILSAPMQLDAYPKIAQGPLGDGSKVIDIGRVQDGAVSTTTLYAGFAIPVRDATPSGASFDYLAPGVIQEGDSGGPVEAVNAAGPLIVAVASATASMNDASNNPNGSYEYLARTDLVAPWIAQEIAAFPKGAPFAPPASADGGAGDGGAPGGYPASFGTAPQVGTSGGQVLAAPKEMAITYDADTLRSQIEQFASTVGATDWWKAAGADYGVGALQGATPVHLSETAPTTIDDSAIQTYLAGKLDGTHPEFGTPNSSTIYTIFYPQTTTITSFGMTSCQGFGGYHEELTLKNGMNIVYAVIPRCPNFGGLNGIDMVTAATSHELIEASTDPYVTTAPAYSGTNDEGVGLELLIGGGEVGDMCVSDTGAFYKPTGYAFYVQRSWSDSAASAGHDPCVPAMGGPYFNAQPQMTDMVTFSSGGTSTQQIKGVKIPVGTSKTIELDLYSDAPTAGDFTVSAVDASAVQGGAQQLTFAFDKTTGHNGDKLHLTITAVAMGQYGIAPFLVETTMNGRTTLNGGVVGQ